MENSAVVVTSATSTRIALILLYIPTALIVYRWLFPRLSLQLRRLAGAVFLAQVLVIVVALEIRPASALEKWIWDFEEEWNIPATLASTQLALVGGFSMLTALFARTQPPLRRLYFVGVGLLFLFFALDEYYLLHEQVLKWERIYAGLGFAVVAATLLVAARSPRHLRIMQLCLLIGLAMAALGGLVFNSLPKTCLDLEPLPVSVCARFLLLGETLELLGIWLALVAALGTFSAIMPAALKRGASLAIYALPLLWILILVFDPLILRLELRFLAQPTAITVETDVRIHGYSVKREQDKLLVQLYASTTNREFIGLGYSIHLVDQASGESIASSDKHAGSQLRFKLDSNFVHVYRQRMELDIPQPAPLNRALWVVLTVWRKEGDAILRRKVIAADRPTLHETQVVLDELVLPADSPPPTASPLAVFTNGFTLAAADIRQPVQAGETADIVFSWRTDTESNEDYTQYLHFFHADSGEHRGLDQQPLGARLPTRLWYSGLADSETWAVPLPADLAPGEYQVFTGLYRMSDMERLPASDINGTPLPDARVPLGSIIIEEKRIAIESAAG